MRPVREKIVKIHFEQKRNKDDQIKRLFGHFDWTELMNVFYFIFANVLSTVLKNAFDAFDQEKNGFIGVTMVGTILGMLGHQLDEKMLNEVVAEVDEDGSGTYYVDIHSCEQNMLSSKRMPEAPSLY